jgi:CheY-like chemotaxis protein
LEQHIEDVSVGPAPGQRILIADDNEVVRKGVCNILRSGLKVEAAIEAVNGKEAVEKARELNPDLVILDMAMPVLDGFSAAERIKKALRSVPICHVLDARRTRGDPGLSRSAVSRYFPGRMYRLQKLPSAFDWSESAAVFTTKAHRAAASYPPKPVRTKRHQHSLPGHGRCRSTVGRTSCNRFQRLKDRVGSWLLTAQRAKRRVGVRWREVPLQMLVPVPGSCCHLCRRTQGIGFPSRRRIHNRPRHPWKHSPCPAPHRDRCAELGWKPHDADLWCCLMWRLAARQSARLQLPAFPPCLQK